MNIFSSLFSRRPAWYDALPSHLRPPKNKIRELDDLRRRLEVDHQIFMVLVGGTKWATIRALEISRDQLRHDLPHYSEAETWRAVILTRMGSKLSIVQNIRDQERLERKMEDMDQIMNSIHSWNEVVNYCVEMDKDSLDNDPMGVKREISEIIMS